MADEAASAVPVGVGDQARIAALERQLHHVASLHERAEGRLQHLLNFPNEIAAMKDKLYDPDIAVPLLQSYDAEIAQLKDKVSVLMHENANVKADNDMLKDALQRAADGRESVVAAQVQQERENVRDEEDSLRLRRAEQQAAELRAELTETQRELSQLRERASAGFVDEAKRRDEHARRSAQAQESERIVQRLEAENCDLEAKVARLLKLTENLQSTAQDNTATIEAQKIQLQLLTTENEDKANEVERLRGKMAQALHQAGENHAMHLKIIEEKHSEAVRAAREDTRAQEVAAAKLRAQLSRAELVPTYTASSATSPTAAVEAQARHSLELELKRLYADLANAQLQRDDALARLEQVNSTAITLRDEQTRDVTRQLETRTMRLREVEQRCEGLERDLERTREQLNKSRADLAAVSAENGRLEREKADAVRAADDANRGKLSAVAAKDAAVAAADEQVEREKRASRSLDRRLEDVRLEMQTQKDRFSSEAEQLKRTVAELRSASRDAQARADMLATTLAEKERAHDGLAGKCDRLLQGLNGHKQQLAALDERLVASSQREAQLSVDLRSCRSALEQAKLDNARIARERDRVASEGRNLSVQLQKYSKAVRKAAAAA